MNRFKVAGLIISSMFLFIMTIGCAPKFLTKEEAYPLMYQERPVSILVLPAINVTTAADAKEYYSVTIAEPLSLTGHYVYPLELVNEILKNEGMYDTELMVNVPPEKFKQHFGADAVMFIKINKWDTSYYVIGGNVTVGVECLLKSTNTGAELWKYQGLVKVDTTGERRVEGLLGLAFQIIETAVKTAMTDYVPIARQANYMTLISMPHGKYHKEFDKDRKYQVVGKSKVSPKKKK